MGKLLLTASFFFFTPLVLVSSILFFLFLSHQRNPDPTIVFSPAKSVAYAALPNSKSFLSITFEEKDIRVERLRDFLSFYKSPLEPFANEIVSVADIYGVDYRLIPAIAMQESNLCKKAPKNSNNCWGYGIYAKKVTKFKNYKEGIATVTKTLAKSYKVNGLVTPEEIMTRYTPSNDGSWADSVTHFMNKL